MQNAKLLIVDDDEDDYLLARDLLDEISRGPYQLDWAASYEQGLEMLRANTHDLCLMDYQLGFRDGIELVRQSQALGFTGPIILLTGMQQNDVDMQALEAGAVDYLVKDGLTAVQLARSIRYALARRDMEQERVERLRAESENRSKSEFLAHLSHELRTPLSAILGFTELLQKTHTDQDAQGYLKIVHRNGKHLLGLLNDILDLSKIEAGKLELEPQTVYLSSFITDVYFLMHGAAVDKNLQLRLEAPNPLPQTIETDPTRLRQILLNLLGNAIKFTDEGEVAIGVELRTTAGGDMLYFTVRDTGIGICHSALEEIFQPFVQSRDSYAQPRAGTGLGLAISRQLVQRLGGEIQVHSVPGEGSEFTFYVNPGNISEVPRAPFTLTFDTAEPPAPETTSFAGRVLVVDDLRDIRMLIGHFVATSGVEVEYASNGREALERIEKYREAGRPGFDLVLMDIHMPVMDGLTAAKALRATGFDRPLVALTAAHMKGDMDNCLAAGFTAYLSKPVDQAQILACLQRFLQAGDSTHKRLLPHVLLVEDSPDTRQATAALLELLELKVSTAANGEEALRHLATGTADVALVDMHLPDMDGYQLARQLHSSQPTLRVIALSGAEIDPTRAEAAGINASLLKPVSLEQLQAHLL